MKMHFFFCSEFTFEDSDEEGQIQPTSEAPRITLVLRGKTVSPGNTVKFACRYKSQNPITGVEWTKNDKVLRKSARYQIEHEGDLCSLTIFDVDESDSGEYGVLVKNESGYSCSKASLQIEGEEIPQKLRAQQQLLLQ